MKRLSDEGGFSAGARNFGRLALAFIPYALGLGALTWLAVFVWVHAIRASWQQEDRAAIYTGATIRPKTKIAVDILKPECVTITRADLDGSVLVLYGRNDCVGSTLNYLEWHWQALSPNGVVIHQGYTNGCPIPTQSGDIAECKFGGWGDFGEIGIETDSRTDKLRVWAGRN